MYLDRTCLRGTKLSIGVVCCSAVSGGRYYWTKNAEKLDWNAPKLSRQDPSVGSIEITGASIDDIGYYQCFVVGKYGTAMSDVTELVMGVIDDYYGDTSTPYDAVEYGQLSLKCNAPRSIPDSEFFWSYQITSSSTDFMPIQLDSRLQVDQEGHVAMFTL